MLLVRVGEIEFRGHTDRGFLIGPGGFKGWEGAPSTRRDVMERPSRHGDFRADGFKASRLVTLSGTALATSEAELAHMGDVLSGLGARRSRVTVTTLAGTRWADGDVEGEIVFDRVGGRAQAPFKITFWFPDPRKYGETQSWAVAAGGSSSMHHRGNFEASPRFIVSGPQPSGYSFTAPGKPSFQVDAPLASGSTDVVDFRTGRVTRNGAPLLGAVPFPRTWTVPGGVVQSWGFASTGSGGVTAELTDTFI